ncbi:MAG: helix-turn-helix domain-containing protein [Atopobiaceae bacterium]|nr:helix-turn-helix domain-containing protein [Atopobiaceae bacterium]
MGTADEHYKIGGYFDRRSFWLTSTPSAAQLEMPYVCTEAGALYGESGFVTERDSKDSYLLFYTFDGAGYVRQNKRTVTVGHGQMLLMDCRTPQAYGTSPKADRWYHIWAHVGGAGVAATARRLGLPALTPISVPSSRVQPYLDTILERLERDSVIDGELVGLAVHGLLSSMLIARSRDEIPQDSPVVLAQNYIARHYGERITVDDLARAAAVSTSYLTRLFRQQMETSPHDYLLRYRITRAKQLLTETDLSIGAIAKQVGFTSESNFSYRFSRLCDTTPRAYRNLTHSSPVD